MSRLPDPTVPRELLSGVVERVTFHNPDSGFCVLRVKARGPRDLLTVVGHVPSITPGESIQASGVWITDKTHGRQFKAEYLTAVAPTSLEGIERYLASGLVKGIGPHFAKQLVAAFGEDVFEVIETTPARLRDVPGIGGVRAARITEGWQTQRTVREIMVFLHAHGVSTSRAVRIFKTYGADAIALLKENPYRLARDIRGIGFVSADRIAARLGIEKIAAIRLRAGIGYALTSAFDDGHCGLPRAELLERATALLEAPRDDIEDALEHELRGTDIVADMVDGEPCVFLAALHRAERAIATRLRAMAMGTAPWGAIDAERALTWVEERLSMTLAVQQREALRLATRSRLLVVTGGPGVGKTTLMQAILKVLTAKRVRPVLCAPTGRAAKRLGESTGLDARTIHRLLEVDPRTGQFRRDEQRPLECDLVVCDETSMVDVSLMHSLVRAVPAHAALILVGDADQLPSVGPGQVLADTIASGVVPVVRLTEVFRQAAESRIIQAAHRVNAGEMPDLRNAEAQASDFYFVESDDPDDAARKLIQIVAERIPARFGLDPRKDVQVLCPMNRGGLGARALNVALQARLNPPRDLRVERFGHSYGVGDKVMQIENDYDKEVYNGDLGLVSAIDPDQQEMAIDFDGRTVVYDFGELDEIVLAYATTIHKAQGSEYPAVVIPVSTQHYTMLQRNLIYTGLTRGKRLVVLVGQAKALAIAVKGHASKRRWSKLKEWLASPP